MTDTKKPVDETGASARSEAPGPEKRRRRQPARRPRRPEARPADRPSDSNPGAADAADARSSRRSRRPSSASVKKGAEAVRSRVASVVWLVAVVCALFLAVGALLVALQMNRDNAIVSFVLDGAHKLDLGEFKKFTGKGADVKGALTNWGIAAVIYLVAGKVLDRIIRP